MSSILFGLLNVTVTMSIVICLILLTKNTLKKKFTATCRFIILSLIMLRLCIPIGLIMPIINIELPSPAPSENTNNDYIPKPPYLPETDFETLYTPENDNSVSSNINTPNDTDKITNSTPTVENKSSKYNFKLDDLIKYVPTLIFFIWLFGACFYLFCGLIQYSFTLKELNIGLKFPGAETREIYSELLSEMKIKRAPRLYIRNNISSPLLFGYFSSKIVLPDTELSKNDIKGILRHELTHYQRGDLYLKLVSLIGNAVHWFNPLAYIAAKMHSEEMELSCDEIVLKDCDEVSRVSYGNTMLAIVRSSRKNLSPLTTSFNPTPSKLKERFSNILDMTKKRKGIAIIIACIIVCVISSIIVGITFSEKTDWIKIVDYKDSCDLYYEKIDTDTRYRKLKLEYKDRFFIFEGYIPIDNGIEVYEYDFTKDGKTDYVVTLCMGKGSSINLEDLYAFDGETSEQVNVEDDIITQIQSQVTCTADSLNYYILIGEKKHSISKDLYSDYEGLSYRIHFGSIEDFYASEEGIFFESTCFAKNDNTLSVGKILAEIIYQDNSLTVGNIEFVKNETPVKFAEYETNDSNWQLYYEDKYLILESINGEKISLEDKQGYGDNIYNFNFSESSNAYAQIFENVAAIIVTKDSTFNKNKYLYQELLLIDLNKKNKLNRSGLSTSPEYTFVIHNLPENILDDYTDSNQENTPAQFNIEASIEQVDSSNFKCYFDLTTHDKKIRLTSIAYIDFNTYPYLIEPYRTEISPDIHYVNKIDNIDDIEKIECIDECAINGLTYFMKNDIDNLADKLNVLNNDYIKELYHPLTEIKFGDYTIERYYGNYLKLSTIITYTNLESLPVGKHEFIFADSLGQIWMKHICCEKDYDKENPAVDELEYYLNACPYFYMYRYDEFVKLYGTDPETIDNYYMNCYTYLGLRYGEMTKAEYKDLARKVFGIEDIHPSEFDEYTDDEKFNHFIGGNFFRSHRIIDATENNGIYSVTVQYYADEAQIIPSDIITYKFSFEDGIAIAGGMTIDYDSKHEIYHYKV